MHLSFLTSHNLLFFSFCKTSKISVFLSFFLVKLSKSQSLKLHISRMAWPILMILVSFCRILNGLSNEINLFSRCSSPLRTIYLSGFICTFLHYVCTGSDMFRSVCDRIDYCTDSFCLQGTRSKRFRMGLPS